MVMRMPGPRRPMLRAAVFSAAALVPVLWTSAATAATVDYPGRCQRSADVVQWTPKKGAVARFIADTFASSSTGLWIGLGRSGTTFWSAEGGDASDACDECRELRLVETSAGGKRKVHTVLGSADLTRIGPDAAAQKAHVLATLWKLASKTWPADKLTQDYTLTTGKPPANDPDGAPPFAVKVTAKDTFDIRYDLGAKKLMCWCTYDWKARTAKVAKAPPTK